MKNKRPQPKVIESKYFIKINGAYTDETDTLAKARKIVKNICITDCIKEVQIVRKTLTETILTKLKPKTEKVLTIDDFFDV